MGRFTVDTHLFRELGELLVGRDSTALVELIKNAYDADSTRTTVYAEALTTPDRGYIEISDDGVGMTPEIFEEGFLRVASRLKASGVRTSPMYRRRMTGEKGIGRLAAHKLAHVMEVTSVPQADFGKLGVSAQIDWDRIEKAATFDELGDVPVRELELNGASHGTTIRLSRLRRAWSTNELGRFLAEVQTFEPPDLLTRELDPKEEVSGPLAVKKPVVRDLGGRDPGFSVQLEGDLQRGDDYWEALWGEIDWVVEIDASRGRRGVRYTVAPTESYLRGSASEGASFTSAHPDPHNGPFFHARFLIREGRIDDARRRRWAQRVAGVRVYYEGFRVLPYGEPGNDWVGIGQRYIQRTRDLPWLSDVDLDVGEIDPDAGLVTPQASAVIGGVFLLEKEAPTLRLLVNREGFVPEAGYYTMQRIVRVGIDLSTRVRASASAPRRQARRVQRGGVRESPKEDATPPSVSESLRRLEAFTSEAQRQMRHGDVDAASKAMEEAKHEAERITGVAGELISERAMLRVLASIGMQMAAFVHETNTALRLAADLEDHVATVRTAADVPTSTQRSLSRIAKAVSDLRRNIERQAAFLVDVVTPDARRRRSAQRLREKFETTTSLVLARARRQQVRIENKIPTGIKTPPMFPAEITTVFMNLLTNAIKAAGEGGTIEARGHVEDGTVHVVVANTGEAVDLENAERWFRPFESTTVELDPVLGQGLGLGLPVTRSMVEEYGGEVNFVAPPPGFATAVEVQLPGARS